MADRRFHQRVMPRKPIPAIGIEELRALEEWEDVEGAELDVVEHFQRQGLMDAD